MVAVEVVLIVLNLYIQQQTSNSQHQYQKLQARSDNRWR